jgi:hypothetical protein
MALLWPYRPAVTRMYPVKRVVKKGTAPLSDADTISNRAPAIEGTAILQLCEIWLPVVFIATRIIVIASKCPLWAKTDILAAQTSCPLYTRKRTFALQQHLYSITSSA